MAYGDKRDYRKIDIYVREQGKWSYKCSTTWARTCKEAKAHFAEKYPEWLPEDVRANFAAKTKWL